MPLTVIRCWVAVCPVCKKQLHLGEGDYVPHFTTRSDLKDFIGEGTDYCPTQEAVLAESCGSECSAKYYELRMKRRGARTFRPDKKLRELGRALMTKANKMKRRKP